MVSYDFFAAELTWLTYRLGSDTSLCNKTYQRILQSSTDTTGSGLIRQKTSRRIGFIRTENSKVFFKKTDKCTDKEYLMYDFGLKKGDSIYCGYTSELSIDTTKFYVRDVDSIVYEGIKRKRLKVFFNEYNNCLPTLPPCPEVYNMSWIEGIGTSSFGGFYPYMCFKNVCEEIIYFICYEENGVTKYQNPEFPNCSAFRTPINEINKPDLKVYLRTNTVTNNLMIDNAENEKIDVFIVNTLGQILMTKTVGESINSLNINQLSNGIYLAIFSKNNQRRVEKFVKN